MRNGVERESANCEESAEDEETEWGEMRRAVP